MNLESTSDYARSLCCSIVGAGSLRNARSIVKAGLSS